RESLALKVTVASRVCLGSLALMVWMAWQALRVIRATRGHRVSLGRRVSEGHRACRALLVCVVPLDRRVTPATKARKVYRGRRVSPPLRFTAPSIGQALPTPQCNGSSRAWHITIMGVCVWRVILAAWRLLQAWETTPISMLP